MSNDSFDINLDLLLQGAQQSDPEAANAEIESGGDSLEKIRENYQTQAFSQKIKALNQENKEKRQSHRLRKEHLNFLSKITVYWLGLITVVSILQGFKGLGFVTFKVRTDILDKLPFYIEYSEFSLSDSVFIALVTTTTATILGLYTIAAIWLYKGKQAENNKKEDPSKADDK